MHSRANQATGFTCRMVGPSQFGRTATPDVDCAPTRRAPDRWSMIAPAGACHEEGVTTASRLRSWTLPEYSASRPYPRHPSSL
jgi:hypothetical protein